MSPFVSTCVFFLSLINVNFAQSLFQEPASALQNLSVEADIDQFTPAFGGLPLNATSNGDRKSQCFTNIPGYPQFLPVARPDCYLLFYLILVNPLAATPFKWEAIKKPLPTGQGQGQGRSYGSEVKLFRTGNNCINKRHLAVPIFTINSYGQLPPPTHNYDLPKEDQSLLGVIRRCTSSQGPTQPHACLIPTSNTFRPD
ncbi:MAG: hypothetical protein Q9170_006892 [Blastenia crenularia]